MKRKLAAPAAASDETMDADDVQEIFRRHFEAQFQPLQVSKRAQGQEKDEDNEDNIEDLASDGSDDGDDDSDWSGFSDDSTPASSVQVVDYSGKPADVARMSRHEQKAILSARPPSLDDPGRRRTAAPSTPSSTPRDAPDLLANDLALQRLLTESHLLAGGRAAPALSALANPLRSSQPFAAGRLRQRALDLRVQAAAAANGSTGAPRANTVPSIYTQKSMPMAIRKGIAAAAAARETRRRREARESGIVLERPSASSAAKEKKRKRLRAIDAPAVGRLHGSELRLRDRDVRAIQGPKPRPGKKHRRR